MDLADRIDCMAGVQCAVGFADADSCQLSDRVERLFRLETLVDRSLTPAASTHIEASALEARAAMVGTPTLLLDLTPGGAEAGLDDASAADLWHLTFDGTRGEPGLVTALLAGRTPVVEIRCGYNLVESGRVGTEHQGELLRSFEDCLARTATIIEGALRRRFGGSPSSPPAAVMPEPAEGPTQLGISELTQRAISILKQAALKRVLRTAFYSPHWRVGWRRIVDGDLFDLRAYPEGGWEFLPDDGTRFYADPFPIELGGRTFLFIEDFAHRRQKGVISVVEFDRDGPMGTPQTVLEEPWHLSYPFVFEAEGEIWMIPESSAASRIDLYRATAFPGGWKRVTTLVAGVEASDATLIQHGDRWWMFATVRDGRKGAFSDALWIWHAPSFRGPWTQHHSNPVLVDIASARPAGRIVERDGVWWRPVQDCSVRYGGALALARIEALDENVFQQQVETVLHPGRDGWPGRRLHTLNRSGSFEFIDSSAPPSLKYAPLRWARREPPGRRLADLPKVHAFPKAQA
nr:formyl transferase [Aurantimonas sp. VKM B-3413]